MTDQSKHRVWRGKDGKFEIEALYLGVFKGNKVKLQKMSGGIVAVPFERLSDVDMAYVNARSGNLASMTTGSPLHATDTITTTITPTIATSTQPMLTTTQQTRRIASPMTTSITTVEDMTNDIAFQDQYRQNQRQFQEEQEAMIILTPVEHQGPQQIRPMCSESVRLLSQRSLSSISEGIRHYRTQRPVGSSLFTARIFAVIAKHLDGRTRARLACVSREAHDAVYEQAGVWRNIWFLDQDLPNVNTATIQHMTDTLLRAHRGLDVETLLLDRSAITADAIVHVLLYLRRLRTLSVRGCWELLSFPLSGKLMHIAMSSKLTGPLTLNEFYIGRGLRRGVDKNHAPQRKNAPMSFGQDISVIQSALEKLTLGRPVQFDCHLCTTCNKGAASSTFECVGCGPLSMYKCHSCAPRCDRCASRVCNTAACRAYRSITMTSLHCGACEAKMAICNRPDTDCQASQKPCGSCMRVYHTICRFSDGSSISNECTGCGKVACPKCELTGCAGGCHGQWCRTCAKTADLIHCKCFILEKHTGGRMIRKNICRSCIRSCDKCMQTGFCERCLHVHAPQCRLQQTTIKS
ncbi:hypothetical protein BCR43DRAFT_488049 [Syncephalastrum racemosum]|uniref:SLA1 homology domain-containing protein n=1 Tax=Syncephalastrum racemosum TaxID=13706 RepID=A0A1X2HJF7_SYNRA|nr:hypothetical protein BCR43DRAFT_488049 [Syncephalastrum racemosum]